MEKDCLTALGHGPMSERKALIQAKLPLSLTNQYELLAVPRSGEYARAQPVSTKDLILMRLLDELYLQWPFYGSQRLCVEHQHSRGIGQS